MENQQSTIQSAEAGAAIYSKPILAIYDIGVIGLSNTLAWRCPSRIILDFYNQHITANHLDIGVGTGYFLDKCRFPSDTPRITLLDLNPNSLNAAAKRLRRYQPITHLGNVMVPDILQPLKFDSIALNFLLHCLHRPIGGKQYVFRNLKPLLNPGGVVFGTTILGQGIKPNFLARRLMRLYNTKGIFSNTEDSLEELENSLKTHFREYLTKVVGCVAFFSAHT